MSKVEYMVISLYTANPIPTIPSRQELADRLNTFAEAGWRIVHFDYDATILERPRTPSMLLEG